MHRHDTEPHADPLEATVTTGQQQPRPLAHDRVTLQTRSASPHDPSAEDPPLSHPNGSRDFFAATLYEVTTQAFVALDRDSRFVYVNGRAGGILGREPAALIGRNVWEQFPDAVGGPFQAAFERAMATRTPVSVDGCFAPWECQCTSRMYPSDDGLLIVFADGIGVDHRKTHGVEQSRYLRAVLDTTPECIKVVARDGTLLDMNAAGLALIEARSLDAVAGHCVFPLVVERDRDAFRRGIEAACDGETTRLELEIVTLGGTRRAIDSRVGPLRDQSGIITGALCLTSDITERRAAEERLRESEARFRRLVERAPIGSYLNDATGRTVYCNPQLATIFGQPAEAIVAGMWRDNVYPADQDRLFAECESFFAGDDDEVRYEYRIVRPDGAIRDLMVEQLRLRTPDRITEGFIGVVDDVTERRALEEQLRQSQKLEAVGQLAGGVAHDFNNLLTVIANYGQFLTRELRPGTQGRADLDELLGATRRATALTRQLLTFGRKQMSAPELLEPNDVIRGVQQMVTRLIGEHITLVTDLDPDTGRVLVDPGQLEQILVNLSVNARDAMPSGGLLTIETTSLRLTPPEIATHSPNGAEPVVPSGAAEYVVVRVTDTGVGMDEATQRRVFEPFFTTKPQGRGTGLGLSTIYGIVTQAGGRVSIRSAPGEGTTVEVCLPRHGAAAAERVPHEPYDPDARAMLRGSETVLLVEDEGAVRESLRRILERAGYDVIEARHGADALLLWREHRDQIALVLTDLLMPEMRGGELAAAVRTMAPDAKIIFMSGYASENARLTVSADDVLLTKPFDAGVLLCAVRAALDDLPVRV